MQDYFCLKKVLNEKELPTGHSILGSVHYLHGKAGGEIERGECSFFFLLKEIIFSVSTS